MDENRRWPAQRLFEPLHHAQQAIGDLLRQPNIVLVGEHDVGGLAPLQEPRDARGGAKWAASGSMQTTLGRTAAHFAKISRVPSVEPSSRTKRRKSGFDWRKIESSCSSRKAAPLKVGRRMSIMQGIGDWGLGNRAGDTVLSAGWGWNHVDGLQDNIF